MNIEGKIILVPTPIGNLGDISDRAKSALANCDVIYCEDTRVTGKLLSLLQIKTPLERMDENTISSKIDEVIERVKRGDTICYCSDAGMPGISDPGTRIVSAARKSGVNVEILPGASASLIAVVASGFTLDEFLFIGFLPKKNSQKQDKLKELLEMKRPTIIYESPKRLLSTLDLIPDSRRVCICRELTKVHEEVLVGVAKDLKEKLSHRDSIKGEIVMVIDKASNEETDKVLEQKFELACDYVRRCKERNLSSTEIKKDLIDFFDISKNKAFELANNL